MRQVCRQRDIHIKRSLSDEQRMARSALTVIFPHNSAPIPRMLPTPLFLAATLPAGVMTRQIERRLFGGGKAMR